MRRVFHFSCQLSGREMNRDGRRQPEKLTGRQANRRTQEVTALKQSRDVQTHEAAIDKNQSSPLSLSLAFLLRPQNFLFDFLKRKVQGPLLACSESAIIPEVCVNLHSDDSAPSGPEVVFLGGGVE